MESAFFDEPLLELLLDLTGALDTELEEDLGETEERLKKLIMIWMLGLRLI